MREETQREKQTEEIIRERERERETATSPRNQTGRKQVRHARRLACARNGGGVSGREKLKARETWTIKALIREIRHNRNCDADEGMGRDVLSVMCQE